MNIHEEEEKILEEIVPKIVTREEWKAKKPKRQRKLALPVASIIFRFTETDPCYTKDHCANEVRKIQEEHMEELKKSDIQHNFVIGTEGSVYEGRGWSHCSSKHPPGEDPENLNGKSVEVAFIGQEGLKPTARQLRSALGLLVTGIRSDYLVDNVGVYQFGFQEPLFPEEEASQELKRNKLAYELEEEANEQEDNQDDNFEEVGKDEEDPSESEEEEEKED